MRFTAVLAPEKAQLAELHHQAECDAVDRAARKRAGRPGGHVAAAAGRASTKTETRLKPPATAAPRRLDLGSGPDAATQSGEEARHEPDM
jgi:hypothetical protein